MMSRKGGETMVQQWMSVLKESAENMKKTRVMVTCAMLLAVSVVLNYAFPIYIATSSRVTFGFLAIVACGYLFGPSPAMLTAVLSDIVVFVLRPTGFYFPGYTITAALGGLIYGLILYKHEVKLTSILLAQALVTIILNIALNSLFSVILQGKALAAILPLRLMVNAGAYPVYVALEFLLLHFLKRQFRRA